MKQSIPGLFRKLFNQKKNQSAVGVSIHADTVRLVKLQRSNDGVICTDVDELAFTGEEQLVSQLGQLIKRYSLSDSIVTIMLPSSKVQTSQIERDEIPETDPQVALRWQLKDLISIPGQDMVCDFIDMPLQPIGQKAKAQVFATSRTYLTKILAPFHEQDVEIANISAEQFGLAQLQNTKDAAQLAFIQHKGREGILLIVKNKQICFARKLRGSDAVLEMAPEMVKAGGSDNIAIEIQRSIDYYESQLKQPPIKNVLIAVDGPNEELLVDALNLALPVKTKPIEIDSVTNGEQISHRHLVTFGAAVSSLTGESAGVGNEVPA
jgi:MSHA biogenesis protein MshI